MSNYVLSLDCGEGFVDYSNVILANGFSMKECVGSQGKHESQTCQLKIQSDSVRSLLLTQKKAVKARLKKDGNIIFSGVIRPALSVSTRARIVDALSVQIIDDTETLHQYVYDQATDDAVSANLLTEKTYYNYYVCNPNSVQNSLAHVLFGLGGVTIKSCPTITEQVSRFDLKPGDYLDDAIGTLLYEFCATYRMTPGGVEIAKVFQDVTGSVSDIRNTLSVKKSDSVANGTTVEFSKYLTQENYKCYSESIGELPGLSNLGGYEITHNYWPKDTKAQTRACWWDFSNFNAGQKVTAKNFRVIAYNEGRSAFYKIPHMTTYDQEKGYPYVEYYGLYKSGVFAKRGMSLEVYCDIDYSAQDTAKAGVVGVSPAKYQAKYIHNLTDAQNLANFQQKVQKGANYTYSFQSTENYAPGATLTLNENSNLNLNSKIRILSKTSTEQEGLYSYNAEGADDVTITEPNYEHESNVLPPVTDVEFLTLSIDNTIYSQDTEETIVILAAGSAFDWYNLTPSWTLNGSAIAGNATTTLSLASTALSVGQNVIAVSVSLDGQITSKAVTLQYIATSSQGEPGAPAKVFSLSASSYSYVISKRQTTDQTIQITLDVQNIDGTVAWSSIEGATFDSTTKVLTIPAGNTIESFTLTATLGDESRSVTLTGVVQEDVPLYFGALSAAPSGSFIPGDHYLNTSEIVPYVFNGTSFIPLTTGSEYFATVMADVGPDFTRLGVQAPAGSLLEKYVAFSASQEGFVGNLGTQNIKLASGGTIESAEYEEGVKGFHLDGDSGIIKAVGIEAKNGEFSGSFKAQTLETVDEVPSISNLQNFSLYKTNSEPYVSKIEYIGGVAKTISNETYKVLSITYGGKIVGSVDGLIFNEFKAESKSSLFNYNSIIWDAVTSTYYVLVEAKSGYNLYTNQGATINSDSLNLTYPYALNSTAILVTDENKADSDTVGTFVIVSPAYMSVAIFYNGSKTYSGYHLPQGLGLPTGIAYHNGHLVTLLNSAVLCHSGSITDVDAIKTGWSTVNLADGYYYYDISYGNGFFVAVGYNSASNKDIISYSSDYGLTWQNHIYDVTDSYVRTYSRVWFINGNFIVSLGNNIYISSSPSSWSEKKQAPGIIDDIVWDGTNYYAGFINIGEYWSADLESWNKLNPIVITSLALTSSNEVVAIGSYDASSYSIQPGVNINSIVDYYSNLIGNGVKDDNNENLTQEPLLTMHNVEGTLNGQALAQMKATAQTLQIIKADGSTVTFVKDKVEPQNVSLLNVHIKQSDGGINLTNPHIYGMGSVPIGFIYTQYPGQASPEDLFDGTWSDISSQYAGAFFRAAGGGDASAFIEGSSLVPQAEGLPNITGWAEAQGEFSGVTMDNNKSCGGAFHVKTIGVVSGGTSKASSYQQVFDFDASRNSSLYGKSSHVTPTNFSIRIWKRIS